ncbi:unnamed protein product [Cyprideis torosa]|uniref:Uncharacterized protein n=1 Tax=Cyprideis torosa TaxID=163714 RepID=A0A7R8WH14_9CRUS|nr:unnamed protein product [Cyprideis torosa]CAG0892721.1 unnamed protein product [Cyprideis torosa]
MFNFLDVIPDGGVWVEMLGYVLAGLLLFLWAWFWLVDNLRKYHQCRLSGKPEEFRSSAALASIPLIGRFSRIHFEGHVVIPVICIFGLIEGSLDNSFWGNYFLLIPRSLIILLVFYSSKGVMPCGSIHAATGVAFILQLSTFLLPMYWKRLDHLVDHALISASWFLSGCCAFVEIFHRNQIMPTVGRCYFLMLSGVYMFHKGIMGKSLGPHSEDVNPMVQEVIQTSHYFAFDAGMLMFIVGLTSVCVSKTVARASQGSDREGEVFMHLFEQALDD